jgi:hypothetical protein
LTSSFSGDPALAPRACELARRGQTEVQLLLDSDFSPAACFRLLADAAAVPAGTRELREIADRSVPGASSRCLETINSIRYRCVGENCLPQSYLFCGQWSYSLVEDPRYALAQDLAHLLDLLHDRIQRICGMAIVGEAARGAREDFRRWTTEALRPTTARLDDLACGSATE